MKLRVAYKNWVLSHLYHSINCSSYWALWFYLYTTIIQSKHTHTHTHTRTHTYIYEINHKKNYALMSTFSWNSPSRKCFSNFSFLKDEQWWKDFTFYFGLHLFMFFPWCQKMTFIMIHFHVIIIKLKYCNSPLFSNYLQVFKT